MANIAVKDWYGNLVYLKGSGAGTAADPLVLDTGAGTIAAGENVIGLIGTSDIVVTVTPAVDTSAYGAGDLLFDATEVANAVRKNAGCCYLSTIIVLDKADQGVPFTLVIANAATDFGTINSAPDPDDTECATIIGFVPVAAADYVDFGGAKVACVRNFGAMGLQAGAATTSLWIAAVNGTGTPTFSAASDLVLKLYFIRA